MVYGAEEYNVIYSSIPAEKRRGRDVRGSRGERMMKHSSYEDDVAVTGATHTAPSPLGVAANGVRLVACKIGV